MNPYVSESKTNSYKKAVEENANGKFYTGNLVQMTSNIVNEIKETKTSLLETSKNICNRSSRNYFYKYFNNIWNFNYFREKS